MSAVQQALERSATSSGIMVPAGLTYDIGSICNEAEGSQGMHPSHHCQGQQDRACPQDECGALDLTNGS